MEFGITQQTAMILMILSVSLSSAVAGLMVGVWYQKRKSDEETQLLVTIWERLLSVNEDVNFLMSFHEDTQAPLRDIPEGTQILDLEVTQPIETRNIL